MTRLARLVVLGMLLAPGLVACSLLAIRTPDKPLSQRDLNTRVLTREYAVKFASRVETVADDIAAQSQQSEVQLNALRWKLAASRASLSASMQMSPLMALLDTWAFSEQMRLFFDGGAGATAFGGQTSKAREASTALAQDAGRLARGLVSGAGLEQYQSFVERYAREHPLTDLGFSRESVVGQWVQETNSQATLLDTVGTVSQSMSDVSDRMRILGQSAPSQAMWEARLALREAGMSGEDLTQAFARADDSLDRLTKLAEGSPGQLRAAVADVRESMLQVSKSLGVTLSDLMHGMHDEREAFAKNVRTERMALATEFDVQRTAIAADAANVADRVVASGAAEVRGFVRELFVYGMLGFLLVVGLPFAAGYFIGRQRGARGSTRP